MRNLRCVAHDRPNAALFVAPVLWLGPQIGPRVTAQFHHPASAFWLAESWWVAALRRMLWEVSRVLCLPALVALLRARS